MSENKWEIGSTTYVSEDDLTWSYTSLNDKLPMFSGVINNDDIKKVIVKTNTFEKEAEIIESPTFGHIWFLILDAPQNPPLQIYGYDESGSNIYSSE
ncbi:hypothetical protein [Marinicrinis lubricantis]|uniref:Uncharacterized protein n=1 Tax=Marinicrinis lubricantis TaxID=2086470 RepID=A0ABW1IQN7_9BACL